MRIFKLILLNAIFLIGVFVIVVQYEKISEQENKLLLQQMEIHTLKAQINLINQSIVMNNMNINNKAISSIQDGREK
ncbi:TPA: hypothetical protein ACX5GG_001230 [Neisseria meningitidis]